MRSCVSCVGDVIVDALQENIRKKTLSFCTVGVSVACNQIVGVLLLQIRISGRIKKLVGVIDHIL